MSALALFLVVAIVLLLAACWHVRAAPTAGDGTPAAAAPLAILDAASHAAHGAPVADLGAWFAQQGEADFTLTDEQWRALAQAAAVTAELAGAAAATLLGRGGPPPMLHLLPLLPADWDLGDRRGCGLWLRHVANQAGWPHARIALAAELPADSRSASPAALLRRLACHVFLTGQPVVGLLVAASRDGRSQASGLLVADLAQARDLARAPYVLLDLETDAGEAQPSALIGKVLASRKAHASQIALLVADGAADPGVTGMAADALPHLDAGSAILFAGGACGGAPAVSFLAALALGRHHALARAAPVVCYSQQDCYRPSAMLLRPEVPPTRASNDDANCLAIPDLAR